MDKQEITKLIHAKSERITFERNANAASSAWNTFVLVNIDGSFVNYVRCVTCDALLKWKPRDGTSGLINHGKACPKIRSHGSQKITDIEGFRAPSTSRTQIPASVKGDIANALVMMCAKDIRPFSVAEGVGFKELAGKLIEIGATYGNVPVKDVIPCATTVSRHLLQVFDINKQAFLTKIGTVENFGVTCDMWTNVYTSTAYLTVTVHFISSSWQLCSRVIATRSIDEAHTAECIRNNVTSVLSDFNCLRQGNVFVTDNAANMKAAFRTQRWVGCSGHNLNLVLSHVFNPSVNAPHRVPVEVIELIDTCKQLVTLCKRTNLSSVLDSTLKQCIVTRWNSIYTMMMSISKNISDLRDITAGGKNKNILRCLVDINESLLSDVIRILEPFDSATKLLSADKRPTLHLVVPTKVQLSRQLRCAATDSPVIQLLKERLAQELELCFAITDIHRIATILDPRMKSNIDIMTIEEHQSAIADLNKQVTELRSTKSNMASEDTGAPFKKFKTSTSENFLADILGSTSTTLNEVDSYMNSSDLPQDIVEYWSHKDAVWPKLSMIARSLLAVPATSTESERAFSLAGRTLEERRSQLAAETVDELLFLHTN